MTVGPDVPPEGQPPLTSRAAKARAKADRTYKKQSRPWPLRHPILSGLGVLIAIIAIVSVASSGGKDKTPTASNNGNNQNTVTGNNQAAAKDVEIAECGTDDSLGTNTIKSKVKVTNNSSKPSNYLITVAFESADGGTQIDTGNVAVQNLAPGQSTVQDVLTAGTAPAGKFNCKVADVTRLAA